MKEEGFIVPDDLSNDDLRLTQFCDSQSIIVVALERAKTLQWHCTPEENCILDKETLSWITADNDTENLPDVRSAKRQKLEIRSKKPIQEANRFGPCTCSDQQLKTFSEEFVPDNTKQTLSPFMYLMSGQCGDVLLVQMMLFLEIFFLAMLLHSISSFIVEARKKDGRCCSEAYILRLLHPRKNHYCGVEGHWE